MGYEQKTVGGGAATPFANEFIKFLEGALSGNMNPADQTKGVASVLSDILSGGAGKAGGSIQDMIAKDTERNAANIRAHYGASGGSSFGTPAAFAEAMFRSEAAPKGALAVNQMQMGALLPLIQMMAGISSQGIPQAQTVMAPSPFTQFLSVFSELASAGAGIAGAAKGKP